MALIVCVEDEAGIRDLIAGELTDAGHEVIEAADGNEALEVIMRYGPDLVVSDWLMPKMSGGELLKTLRRDHPQFADMPFVIVSAFIDKEYVEQSTGLGVDAYLTKPIDFDLLLETVNRLLSPN